MSVVLIYAQLWLLSSSCCYKQLPRDDNCGNYSSFPLCEPALPRHCSHSHLLVQTTIILRSFDCESPFWQHRSSHLWGRGYPCVFFFRKTDPHCSDQNRTEDEQRSKPNLVADFSGNKYTGDLHSGNLT